MSFVHHHYTERQKFDLHEERLALYSRDQGICQFCGLPVGINEFQVAHRIAQTKTNYRKFGKTVIDSPLNKAITHPGRCNDGMNCGFNPAKCQEIVSLVEATK